MKCGHDQDLRSSIGSSRSSSVLSLELLLICTCSCSIAFAVPFSTKDASIHHCISTDETVVVTFIGVVTVVVACLYTTKLASTIIGHPSMVPLCFVMVWSSSLSTAVFIVAPLVVSCCSTVLWTQDLLMRAVSVFRSSVQSES